MMLDTIDRAILNALQNQGRISNAELAELVNLSPSACHRRVQRLEKDGYIKQYVALLNARKIGLPTTVFVEIRLSAQADEVLDNFEKAVARIPDVLECHLMAGTADYILKVVAENTEEFANSSPAPHDCPGLHKCSLLLRCEQYSKPQPCPSRDFTPRPSIA